jgi:TetR/AcrR family transcriptional repressor of nem operon
MPKPSNREQILLKGLEVVHAHGFAGASVRDIVRAAGVPQGCFTNHFASKEAFGLEVLDLYLARARDVIGETLRNEALPPLERLGAWIDAGKSRLERNGTRNGCLFGNFTAEATEHSEAMRLRLVAIFAEIRDAVASCLRAAVASGDVPSTIDCHAVAGFVVSSMQGAYLLSKAERDIAPIDRFKTILFTHVLRRRD